MLVGIVGWWDLFYRTEYLLVLGLGSVGRYIARTLKGAREREGERYVHRWARLEAECMCMLQQRPDRLDKRKLYVFSFYQKGQGEAVSFDGIDSAQRKTINGGCKPWCTRGRVNNRDEPSKPRNWRGSWELGPS